MCGGENDRSLGLRFEAAGTGAVRARFQASPALQGYDGILHGGVISAVLDAAMTNCLFHLGVQGVTGDLHVRFIEPVSCQSSVDVRASLLSATPPLYRLRSEIVFDGRTMARAEGKFMKREQIGPGDEEV
jgi:acyl-coenzyme A thioesterase PaaI-like protein